MPLDPRDRSYSRGGLKRLGIATAAMAGVLVVSSSGFFALGQMHHSGVLEPRLEEPWTPFDCMYMTVVTVSTIGYTETLPLGAGHTMEDFRDVRIYTMIVILLAMLVVGFSVSSATAFLIEGDLIQFWQRRRAVRDASRMQNHYIVCGGGVTGSVIIDELVETRHRVVVIEKDAERAVELRQRYPEIVVMVGDAMRDEVLVAAGLPRASGLAAALPGDRDNVFLIISARRKGRNGLRIVSLASDTDVREKLVAAGADGVVAASHIGGLRLASELFRPAVVSFLDLMLRGREGAPVRFAELSLGRTWAGKTLAELDLRGTLGLPVLAMRTADTDFVFNPDPETELVEGAVLVTMGDAERVEAAEELVREES